MFESAKKKKTARKEPEKKTQEKANCHFGVCQQVILIIFIF